MRTRRPWVLLGLVVALLSTAGCEMLGLTDPAPGATESAPGAGQSWVLVEQGRATASPSPRVGPSLSPSPWPPRRKTPPPAATANPGPSGNCAGQLRMGAINGLDVEPAPGRATVSWFSVGDPGLRSYRLAAVAQRLVAGAQPEPRVQTIEAGAGCREMTATVTGLDSGAPYVFSLDAVTASRNSDGTRSATVARSQVVTIECPPAPRCSA